MKIRTDSPLSELTDDQQAQICDWLETLGYTETLQKLAAPAPDGFGIQTHRATLHRFYRRFTHAAKQIDLQDALELHSGHASSLPLLEGSEDAVRHLAYHLSTAPDAPARFKDVSRWLTKQQFLKIAQEQAAIARDRMELEKQRLSLDREKWQFNAARQVIIHYAKVGDVIKQNNLDNQDKINAVRSILWGIPIDKLP